MSFKLAKSASSTKLNKSPTRNSVNLPMRQKVTGMCHLAMSSHPGAGWVSWTCSLSCPGFIISLAIFFFFRTCLRLSFLPLAINCVRNNCFVSVHIFFCWMEQTFFFQQISQSQDRSFAYRKTNDYWHRVLVRKDINVILCWIKDHFGHTTIESIL